MREFYLTLKLGILIFFQLFQGLTSLRPKLESAGEFWVLGPRPLSQHLIMLNWQKSFAG
jgi:hypothetical protein